MTTKKIIRQIAKQNGVTPQEVINDMKEAIRVGMASTEPTARAFWQQIAPEGKEPSIDVFLKACISKVHTQTMS
ncbi:MAG: hypothetical protein J6B88_00110 [Clostridia bacterium]|nr:hypothetical protein [Clostridia bacterium]